MMIDKRKLLKELKGSVKRDNQCLKSLDKNGAARLATIAARNRTNSIIGWIKSGNYDK